MINHGLPSIAHSMDTPDKVSSFLPPEQALEEFIRIARGDDEESCKPPEPMRSILKLIDASAADEKHRRHPDLLCIPCGIGKSTAVSWRIRETLCRNDGHGLIAITDDVKRLNGYLTPQDEKLKEYLTEHNKQITLMSAGNAAHAHQRQFLTPILLMTTQRFLSMSRDRFSQYLTWRGGDRPLILIDEYTPLREIAIISLADVNDIATMLEQGVSNAVNQVEKLWCIEQWEYTRKRLAKELKHLESARPEEHVSSFFYYNPERRMTQDDLRFWRFVRSNIASFMGFKNGHALKRLEQVYRIETEGALYQGRRDKEYSNKLAIMLDHRDRFADLSAKMIILDGTADLHPDYRQDYIRRVDIAEYPSLHRRLDHLTIRIFNVPTSKRRLLDKENGDKLKQCIADEVTRKVGTAAENTPIFTYSDTEKFFRKAGFRHVEHFGNIKGSNDYRNEHLIVQIGLNRCEPLYYEAYALYSDPQRIAQLRTMPQDQGSDAIKLVTEEPKAIENLMNRMLLVDIEQNFYRSAIRKADCTQDVEYWMFFNADYHRELIEMMRARYGRLGARVMPPEQLTGFKEFKSLTRKTEKPTTVQLYSEYLNSKPSGFEFTRGDILRETGITNAAFSSMLRAHPEIKERLKNMRVPGKERVYRKP